MKLKAIIFALVISLSLFAEIDISSYELTSSQIEILRNLEAKNKFTDEWLLNFAKAMHNSNIQREARANMYIPPYTPQELDDTILWARGGAFAAYAQFAGMTFDGVAYRDDCPNVGLFRFGKATGTEFIKIDVLKDAMNQSFYFQQTFANDKENFKEKYLEQAQYWGFLKYLSPIE